MKDKNSIPEEEFEEETESGGFGARVAAIFSNTRNRIIMISALALICVVCLIVGIVVGVKSCGSTDGFNPVNELYKYDLESHKTNTLVKYSAQTTGTVKRVKPVAETRDERDLFTANGFTFDENKRYPTYGSTLKYVLGTEPEKVAARNALIRESGYLCAYGTSNANTGTVTPDKYVMMDKDGWLYQIKDGERIHSLVYGETEYTQSNYRRLYKHSASEGLYLGDVADNEKGIIKQVTLRNRAYNSYSVTGVYAPAGEVIKIQISDADMKATGGITIHIGQALYNGQANNIWAAKNQMQRFPHLLNTMSINQNTADYDESTGMWTGYVGSFIGGPLYIRNNSATFTATISGGVAYSHFILGYTTQKEFEENAKSSAPYFDLEVWDRGVLHSGPKKYATSFSYDDLYNVAVLWDKVASVTTTGSNQGIVFLYDPFVAAGAAVAFPGRSSVNCPLSWMPASLDYNAIVTSGSWGNFHEYHHNFQGYGVGNGGEVTNNGMTLVSYSLFTKITSNRGIGSYGAQGLGTGWNRYTSATWSLWDVLKISRGGNPSNGKQGLALYATLLHNLGPDNYIKAKVAGGGQSYQAYMNAWEKVTHTNMYYYFHDILQGGVTENSTAATDYPMFVPVASVYQTGRSYAYYDETTRKVANNYIKTMQPYVIPYGEDFTLDLRKYEAVGDQYQSGSIVIPDGFTFRVKKVTKPENGTLTETSVAGVYTYKPDTSKMNSGKFIVTLEITKDDKAFGVADVDLVLELEQSREFNKMTINRTTYTYAEGSAPTDAVAAYESGFAGYISKNERNQSNPTQNANTDIWFYPDNEQNRKDHPDAPEEYFAHKNTVEVLDGKLYFEEDGKYRIYMRGRINCAVYFSLDGKDESYKLGAVVKNGSGAQFYTKNHDTYFDVEFSGGKATVTAWAGNETAQTYDLQTVDGNWVYVREVLIVDRVTGVVPYIGLGSKQWTKLSFNMADTYYAADGKTVESTDDPKYSYTETVYTSNDNKTVAVAVTKKGSNTTEYYEIVSGKRVNSSLEKVTELTAERLIEPTSASYVNAYRLNYQFPDNKSFESDYFYVRSYNYNYIDNYSVPKDEMSLTETNYKAPTAASWGNFPIENLNDGKNNTYIHTGWKVTEANPFDMTFDLGAEKKINRISFYCRNNNGQKESPKCFTVLGSLDGETYFEVAKFDNAPLSGHEVTVNFDSTAMRYCSISITATHQGSYYVVLGEVTFTHSTEIMGGNNVSPDNSMFKFEGNWHGAQTVSNFGHVYVGTKGSTVSFEFEGTRLGIFGNKAYGKNYTVKIDGKEVESIELKDDDFGVAMEYLSVALESGKHKVVITCTDVTSIDSFVFYP